MQAQQLATSLAQVLSPSPGIHKVKHTMYPQRQPHDPALGTETHHFWVRHCSWVSHRPKFYPKGICVTLQGTMNTKKTSFLLSALPQLCKISQACNLQTQSVEEIRREVQFYLFFHITLQSQTMYFHIYLWIFHAWLLFIPTIPTHRIGTAILGHHA